MADGDNRARLEELRARARMAELQAKRDGAGGGPKVIQMPVQEIQGDPGPLPSRTKNLADHAASGMTLGLSDHAAAAGQAVGSHLKSAMGGGGEPMGYRDALTHHRAQMERGREAYPESIPAQLAGAIRTGSGVAKALPVGLAPQAAGGAGVAALASGGDPTATVMGAAGGAAGSKLAQLARAKLAAQAASGMPKTGPLPGSTMIGAPPAASAPQPSGPGLVSALGGLARQTMSSAKQVGLEGAGGAMMGLGKPAATLAAMRQVPAMAQAAAPVAQAVGRGAQGAAAATGRAINPATTGAAAGAAGTAAGPSSPRDAIMGLMRGRREEAQLGGQLDGVRRAYVGGELEPELAAELGDTIENKGRGALAAKYHDLVQTNPDLAKKLKRWMRTEGSP